MMADLFHVDFSDPQFWVGLGQILIADILLSGDNAVVIALAARSLPEHQRRWAVLGGSFGAVALRVVFAVFITWLMSIPFLKAIGGLLLLWIGAKLMVPEDGHGEDGIKAQGSLWGAMRTIIMADAVMSLDNVIAIAAAAKGDVTLLVLGLLISIPLVVFGSVMFLKLLDRYPIIVVLGAALLGYIAGQVIVSDAIVDRWIGAHGYWLHYAGPIVGVLIVLGWGMWMKRRALSRMRHREVEDIAVEKH